MANVFTHLHASGFSQQLKTFAALLREFHGDCMSQLFHSSHLIGGLGKLTLELKLDRFEPTSRDAATHPPVTHSALACAQLLSQGTDTTDQLNGFFEGLYFVHAPIITNVLGPVNTNGLLG